MTNTRRPRGLKPLLLSACLAAGLASIQWPLSAQGGAAAPAAAVSDALKSLAWRSIGPTAQAGRVPVFVGLPGDVNTM